MTFPDTKLRQIAEFRGHADANENVFKDSIQPTETPVKLLVVVVSNIISKARLTKNSKAGQLLNGGSDLVVDVPSITEVFLSNGDRDLNLQFSVDSTVECLLYEVPAA